MSHVDANRELLNLLWTTPIEPADLDITLNRCGPLPLLSTHESATTTTFYPAQQNHRADT